jgi:phosphatidylserine decarboxylase
MADRLAILLQHVLPKRRLTELAGRIAGARGGVLSTSLIRWFAKRYGVDMSEAADPDFAGTRASMPSSPGR